MKRTVQNIDLAGAEVPSILQLPQSFEPVPAALLLHGYSSSKQRLADTMGRALQTTALPASPSIYHCTVIEKTPSSKKRAGIRLARTKRLFEAAEEPKELRWYNSGHVLPPEAADDAAKWLVDRFS